MMAAPAFPNLRCTQRVQRFRSLLSSFEKANAKESSAASTLEVSPDLEHGRELDESGGDHSGSSMCYVRRERLIS
eukprot:3438031-Rhodomonas_salina.4